MLDGNYYSEKDNDVVFGTGMFHSVELEEAWCIDRQCSVKKERGWKRGGWELQEVAGSLGI